MGNASVKQRGAINWGCLVLVVLLAILTYFAYRIVPVYLEREAFHDGLLRIAGRATIKGWDDRKVIQEVLNFAKSSKFKVDRQDIEIHRVPNRPEVIVIVNYRRTEAFPGGYEHRFAFRSVAEGSLGF